MKKKTSSGAIAFALLVYLAVLLTAFLAILKLCGIINLSWWWVTAPAWVWLLLVLLSLGFIFLCAIVLSSAAKHRRK